MADNTTNTGQSGWAQKNLQNVRNINPTASAGGTRIVDGKPMTLVQAIDYINQVRISDYNGKYQVLKQMINDTGKSDQGTFSKWNAFIRDLFSSNTADLNTYAAERATANGGTSTAAYPSITSKETADFNIDKIFIDATGLPADAKEKTEYYNKLIALEKSRPTKQITTTSNGRTVQTTIGGVTESEKERIGLELVAKRLKIGDVKTVGGTIASGLAAITKFASDYGVSLPDADVRKAAIDYVVNGQSTLDNNYARIKLLAKAMFPALSTSIDAGLSVADVASQYITEKANLLELNPASLSLKTPDIMQAISGQVVESIADFRKRQKSNPLYAYTNNALNEVGAFIQNFKTKTQVRKV